MKKPTVWVVDDDSDVLDALSMLLKAAGFQAVACQSGAALLEKIEAERPGCILLDLRMPGMGGLEVQRELVKRKMPQPVVFLSGHGDIPVAVRAVQAGALDFLEKPAREQQLVAAVKKGIEVDRKQRASREKHNALLKLVDSLSPREAEVAELVAQGMKTAEIAERLGLSPRTVDMHRARLLKRVGARNSAEAATILQNARSAGK